MAELLPRILPEQEYLGRIHRAMRYAVYRAGLAYLASPAQRFWCGLIDGLIEIRNANVAFWEDQE